MSLHKKNLVVIINETITWSDYMNVILNKTNQNQCRSQTSEVAIISCIIFIDA